MISFPDKDVNQIKSKRTFAQACKECNALPLSEFEAEWTRQLELHNKNKSNKS